MSNTRVVRNKDNDLLLPWGNSRLVVGYVDEVNGPGAAEIPDFVPTRHELLQLVKFWVKEALAYEFTEEFLYAQSCHSGSLHRAYAWRRISRIGNLLGKKQHKEAVEAAYAEFGKNQEQRYWEIFMHGDSEDSKALQDEIQDEIEDHFRKREGRQTESGG